MDTNEQINILVQIATTLNGVEVKGKQNLMSIMGSIGALEDMINKLSQQQKEETKETPQV